MEEEISLRELIEVLLRGKRVIAGVTLAFILIAGVISFFVLHPQYEGRATLMVNQTKFDQPKTDSSLDALMQVLSSYPEMTLEAYSNEVANPVILKQVIGDLKLDPEKYTIDSLGKSISTEVVKNTNLINIVVKGDNPEEVARIANSVAAHFVDYISAQSKQQLGQSLVFLKDQMTTEDKSLQKAVGDYKNFLAQPEGVQELKAEVEAKIALLTNFKGQLIQNGVDLQQATATLKQVESDLSQTPEKLVVKKSLSDDPYLMQVLNGTTGAPAGKLSGLSMESEEINDVYTSLCTKRNDLKAQIASLTGQQEELGRSIDELQSQLEQMQADLAEKDANDQQLSQKVDTIRNNFQTLSKQYQDTRLSQAAKIGDANINIVVQALKPDRPVGPRKMLNMAVAGVLGVMISVFAVFFMEFWRKTGRETAQ